MVLSPGTALSINQTVVFRVVEEVSHIWAYVYILVAGQSSILKKDKILLGGAFCYVYRTERKIFKSCLSREDQNGL